MLSKPNTNQVLFDKHQSTYTEEVSRVVRFSGKGIDFFTKVKADGILKICHKWLGDSKTLKAINIGCGIGTTDSLLATQFQEYHGVDVSEASLTTAKKSNPKVAYHLSDGITLPAGANAFDVSMAICVMHHVTPEKWAHFLSEMNRVTKPGGIMVICEHNPLNPLTRLAVARCEFDRDATLLGPSTITRYFKKENIQTLEKQYILYLPISSPWVHQFENWINPIPLGAQYLVAGRKNKPI